MASSACFLCPGKATIWISTVDVDGDPALTGTANPTTTSWLHVPHTVSWEFTADVEDPTEIRTSQTNNKKVKPCGGATSFELAVTSALCADDWLYAYILDSPYTDPAEGADLWFYLCWDGVPCVITAGATVTGAVLNTNGVWARGTVQAPGLSFDNDSSDPTIAEWTVKVTDGPYLPNVTGTSPRTIN